MKHVLFTTTALVVLGSTSAFADVTWSGSADLSYNDGNMDSAEGSLPDGVNLDVDLDVTLSNAGGFSATLSGAMEGGAEGLQIHGALHSFFPHLSSGRGIFSTPCGR